VKNATIAVLSLVLAGSAAGRVQAQGAAADGGFIVLEGGAQPQQRTLDTAVTFPLYDETATISTSQLVHNGPLFGVGGGYRLVPSFGIGATVTVFSARKGDASVVASLPDISITDRFSTVTATVDGLQHREVGVHLQAIWFGQFGEHLPVTLSAGPSIVRVTHDVATARVPTGSQSVATGKTTEKKAGVGVNVGGTVAYPFSPALAAQVFVRYAGGKVDLPSAADVSVGGLQLGAGLRYGF
jgi:hypothetical protein